MHNHNNLSVWRWMVCLKFPCSLSLAESLNGARRKIKRENKIIKKNIYSKLLHGVDFVIKIIGAFKEHWYLLNVIISPAI